MTIVTIVMYHYVREIKNSKYPNIKGLEVEGFRRQLDYLQRNYTIIDADRLIAHRQGGTLPRNPCLLTFDDGYKDHIRYVLPELLRRRIQGSFFPPVKPVVEREVLDVNSIHFILASCADHGALAHEVDRLCSSSGVGSDELRRFRELYARSSRFDIAEVMYVKNLLQHALPKDVRQRVIGLLFEKYVGTDTKSFAEELYLSVEDTRTLVASGMYVGSHGYRHVWLNKETEQSQRFEIDSSLEFLKSIGAPTGDWIMCYPYGAYDATTLDILKDRGCAVGLTTKVGAADLKSADPLELPRLDTNDFPQ